jgi:hypothetical protein
MRFSLASEALRSRHRGATACFRCAGDERQEFWLILIAIEPQVVRANLSFAVSLREEGEVPYLFLFLFVCCLVDVSHAE